MPRSASVEDRGRALIEARADGVVDEDGAAWGLARRGVRARAGSRPRGGRSGRSRGAAQLASKAAGSRGVGGGQAEACGQRRVPRCWRWRTRHRRAARRRRERDAAGVADGDGAAQTADVRRARRSACMRVQASRLVTQPSAAARGRGGARSAQLDGPIGRAAGARPRARRALSRRRGDRRSGRGLGGAGGGAVLTAPGWRSAITTTPCGITRTSSAPRPAGTRTRATATPPAGTSSLEPLLDDGGVAVQRDGAADGGCRGGDRAAARRAASPRRRRRARRRGARARQGAAGAGSPW